MVHFSKCISNRRPLTSPFCVTTRRMPTINSPCNMVLALMPSQATGENGYTENKLIDIVLVYGTVSRVSFVVQSQMSYVTKCQKDNLPPLSRGRSSRPSGRSYV